MSSAAYRAANREKLNERQKAYYAANRPARLAYQRAYVEENHELLVAKQRAYYAADPARRLLSHARRRAQQDGLPFSLTKEDITVPMVCPVLGIPLFSGTGQLIDNSPTLDRFIPERGYVPGNVTVISNLANRIKTNATVEQIEAVARWMRKEDQ